MEDVLIDLGVSAMLRAVQSAKQRKKWARALAKVFDAIARASRVDDELRRAIEAKQQGA